MMIARSTLCGDMLADIRAGQAGELLETLVSGPAARIERIVSTGQASPPGFWYDQDEDEFVLLLTGAAGVRIEGERDTRRMAPGQWLHLPAHCRHRVEWTQADPPTVWLAVFIPAAGEPG